MSGFLRSLAAHGTTQGPRLRPIAVPFARAPFPSDRPDQQEVDAEIPAQPAAPSPPDTPAPRAATAWEGKDDKARRRPMSLTDAIVHLTEPPKWARESQASAATASQPRIGPLPAPQPVLSTPVAAGPRADATPQLPRPGRDRSTTPAGDQRITPIHAKTPAIAKATPVRITERRDEPARHRQESVPDVHIHIGRIELTAVTPPAPPRRQQATTKAAMPLDEYLQRRNGRAR